MFLILAGAVLIFVVEWRRAGNEDLVGDGLHLFLISLFHSISARDVYKRQPQDRCCMAVVSSCREMLG